MTKSVLPCSTYSDTKSGGFGGFSTQPKRSISLTYFAVYDICSE